MGCVVRFVATRASRGWVWTGAVWVWSGARESVGGLVLRGWLPPVSFYRVVSFYRFPVQIVDSAPVHRSSALQNATAELALPEAVRGQRTRPRLVG